ncbi:MAG: BamA/TamA family outer membrane protein [Candidatus Aminicenantes bacterium]|nr:BamA/TamA family outer membrane protein [Candidatus Aminicenantes bacterium]
MKSLVGGKKICLAAALLFLFAPPARGSGEARTEAEKQDKARVGAVVLPVLFNMPETQWGGGVGGLLTYRPADSKPDSRPSSLYFYAVYTQLKQFATKWEPEAYFRGESFFLKGKILFERYPEKTWGLGNEAPAEREEDFTPRTFVLELSFQKKLWTAGNLYAGPLYQFESYAILKTEPGGLLDSGTWPGASGGTSSGAGFIINWDTRDNVFFPERGMYCQVSAVLNSGLLGSGFNYASLKLDLRRYVSLLSSHVLALQALYQAVVGEPPFKSIPKLGGDSIMRGYYSGRYRDRHLLAFQAEYRLPVWWRFGLVGFAGLGQVAERPGRFGPEGMKCSAGFGVRFKIAPSEGTNIRLDFAWGKGTSGFYFTAGEAF